MALNKYLRLRVLLVFRAVLNPHVELGRDHVLHAGPAALGEHLAHDRFGLAAAVGLGVVEEVHTCVHAAPMQSAERLVSS